VESESTYPSITLVVPGVADIHHRRIRNEILAKAFASGETSNRYFED
jgi:hypothetical protein